MIGQSHRTWGWMLGMLCIGLAATVVLRNTALQGQTPPKSPTSAKERANQPPKDRDLQTFMRKKLGASNQVLEGLCTEDMNLVAEGAKALHELSEGERWHVSNDVLYKQFSNEFRQITKDLVKAAEEDKADRATLKWLDATVSCLDCHRFVRGLRIVNDKSRSEKSQP